MFLAAEKDRRRAERTPQVGATIGQPEALRAIPLGIKCPKCIEGDLAERRTKRGKSFWGCVRYPACDFSTWNRPVPDTCAECGWIGMEKKVSKTEGETRTCLKCGNKIVLAEPEEVALA